jgi:hypothetical protein
MEGVNENTAIPLFVVNDKRAIENIESINV